MSLASFGYGMGSRGISEVQRQAIVGSKQNGDGRKLFPVTCRILHMCMRMHL